MSDIIPGCRERTNFISIHSFEHHFAVLAMEYLPTLLTSAARFYGWIFTLLVRIYTL